MGEFIYDKRGRIVGLKIGYLIYDYPSMKLRSVIHGTQIHDHETGEYKQTITGNSIFNAHGGEYQGFIDREEITKTWGNFSHLKDDPSFTKVGLGDITVSFRIEPNGSLKIIADRELTEREKQAVYREARRKYRSGYY